MPVTMELINDHDTDSRATSSGVRNISEGCERQGPSEHLFNVLKLLLLCVALTSHTEEKTLRGTNTLPYVLLK